MRPRDGRKAGNGAALLPFAPTPDLQPLCRKVLLPDVVAFLPIHTVVPALGCVLDERGRNFPLTLGRRFPQISDCVRAVMVQIPAELVLTESAPFSFSSHVSPKD